MGTPIPLGMCLRSNSSIALASHIRMWSRSHGRGGAGIKGGLHETGAAERVGEAMVVTTYCAQSGYSLLSSLPILSWEPLKVPKAAATATLANAIKVQTVRGWLLVRSRGLPLRDSPSLRAAKQRAGRRQGFCRDLRHRAQVRRCGTDLPHGRGMGPRAPSSDEHWSVIYVTLADERSALSCPPLIRRRGAW